MTFNDIMHKVAQLASDGKELNDILKTEYKDAYNALSTTERVEMVRTYYEAVKYAQNEAQEELEVSSTIGNINCLV